MLDGHLLKDDISTVDLDLVVFTARSRGREGQRSRHSMILYLVDYIRDLQGLYDFSILLCVDIAGEYRFI